MYFVYIVTSPDRTAVYIGVTNNLVQRLAEHWQNRGKPETYAGRYFCYNLVFYETFQYINKAIEREKELKGWRREKKDALVGTKNPSWTFMNYQFCGFWPPPHNMNKRF